jgi:hypothetical protein
MSGHGTFVWNELMTSDVDRAEAFYGALLGWRFERVNATNPRQPATPDGPSYTLIRAGDRENGGMMSLDDAGMAGLPSHWTSYIAVDDVDAAVRETERLGGSVRVPPFDIPTVGRMAVIADPMGAVVCLMTEVPGEGC